jgi:ElaB/YqjD/DUF883 family membrane-anchored ribosome-binding protein
MDRSMTDRSTADETTELYREIDKLRSDLRQLRGDIGVLGGDALRTARAGITETIRNASTQGKAVADGAGRQISEHPFLAVGAAFAMGMLLGLRASRKG